MTDDEAMKLQLGPEGHVWFALGRSAAVESTLDAEHFVAGHASPQWRVRVLGTAANAPLIRELMRIPSMQLEIGGPQLTECPRGQSDPPVILHAMRQCHLPASLGGWHAATAHDRTVYCLLAYLQAHAFDELSNAMLCNHPAWYGLGYIPHVNKERCATLLNEIVDPRWFIDPNAPNRTSRLFAYLGLHPYTQAEVDGGKQRTRQAQRCQLVQDCWDTRLADEADPAAFLCRIYQAEGGGVRGHLRASQKFIIFLRHTWLHELYRHTRYSGAQGLFAPDMLFKSPAEISAFRAYQQTVCSRLDKPGDSS